MTQGKEHIDKLIQEKLQTAEVTPPASVWDSIESSLEKKQRKSAIVLYRWSGSAAAILLLGFLAFYLVRSERQFDPIQDKLTQEIIIDSINKQDTISVNNSKSETQEERQDEFSKSNISSLAFIEKETILQNQSDIKAVKQIEELPSVFSSTVSREDETILALNRLEQGELRSIFKQNANPIIALKANFLRMILASDDLSSQLAERSKKPNKKGWSIGLAFAPTNIERSTGFLTRNAEYFYDAANSESTYVSEKDLPAYSGGVNMVYQLSERWSFQSGIYYLKQGQRIENFSVLQNELSASNNSNSYFGNITFDNYALLSDNGISSDFVQLSDAISYSSYDASLLQQFELIEIPLIATYKIINRKTVFSIMAGISPGILVGNNVYLEGHSSEAIGKTEAVNDLIYKSILGVNLEYPLSRKLYFNFSPSFKYQLNNFNKNATVNEKLNYLEFKTGLNYRF